MCGICGFFSPTPHDVTATAQMLSRTRHRGPDQVGIYLDGERFLDDTLDNIRSLSDVKGTISLGHARLEIIGGPEGAQPITGCRRGWAIVVNGEIYNHVELRRFMSGHPMKTESDSELILHLIETHHQGDLGDAVRRTMPYLDGMYAFAVTDGETLVVARDPIGKKPVYFTQGSILAFASERKALTDFDAPIRRLTPGGILVIGPEGFRVLHTPRFERPQLDIIDPDDALEQYRRAFERSVSKRVRGLDRIGVLFSGGIDSRSRSACRRD
jgi:asparagine synthase (glutamine-hydrolysing)